MLMVFAARFIALSAFFGAQVSGVQGTALTIPVTVLSRCFKTGSA
ncbi:hypothetical protein [Frankia sp. Cr2]|nr:hypothetical protein [Frankia sp. Cr2]